MLKKVAISILEGYKRLRLFSLKLRGKTEEDVHAERVVSGKSWAEFCDTLKAAGASLVYGNSPMDAFNQAEGLRYLSRLTRAGLEAFIEYADPKFPVLRRMVHETVKMGADNPDNYYQNAQISGDYEYKITGHRGTVHYLGLFTQNGNYGSTGGLAPCGVLDANDMVIEEDGSFEVILSKQEKGKNWLKIEDETTLLMVRQTFLDRENEKVAEMRVERIGGQTTPDPITPKLIDEGLNTAGTFVAGATMLFARWANGFQKHSNQLPLFDPAISNAAGGDASITYYHSHWKLDDDEALVIKVKPPGCESWNFQLNNYWMESLDYRFFPVCINKHSARYNEDGSVTIIVAHQDPGVPNWITTADHHTGTMCFRWYRSEEKPEPVPQTKVVKFTELASKLEVT